MAKKQSEEFICDKQVTLVRDLKPLELLSPEQIKAARALLRWSQADLAKRCGYSLPAINNIERGTALARPETMADIQQTFELNGVQFIDGPGVRIEEAFFRIKILEGTNGALQLFRNIVYVLEKEGGDLYFSGMNEKFFKNNIEEALLAFQMKLADLKDIKVKILCTPEQDAGITFKNGEKRLVVKNSYPLTPSIIYRDRVAHLFFENPFRIMVLTHQATADLAREQFNFVWNSL